MLLISTKNGEVYKLVRGKYKQKRLSLTEYRTLLLLAGNNKVMFGEISDKIYQEKEPKYYKHCIYATISRIKRKLGIQINSFSKYGYQTDEIIYIE